MRILRYGSRGPAVQLLQLALDRAGFGPLTTDGAFGPATEAALRRFQAASGLAPDGVAGSRSHAALRPWYTGYLLHSLRPGDSFWSLGQAYGCGEAAVALANPGLPPERLPVGAELVVPLPFPVVPTAIDWCAALVGFCVQGLAARYPFLRSGQFGRSVLGRPLWKLTLGQGRRRALYNAVHHANEWIAAPLLLCFAEELAAAYAAGGTVAGLDAAALLAESTLCLVPAVNPDGMDLVTGELQSGESYERARRIAAAWPRFPFPGGWKANLRGVDLNLQYPAGWERAREIKFAQGIVSPAPADYVGAAPLTAPEARALHDLTLRFDPALVQAWHSQGEVIYWRFLDYDPPGARALGERFAAVSGYTLAETPYASGFAGYKDWFIQDFGRPGYTVEVGRGTNPLPIADFDGIYRRVRGILAGGMTP
ncbi:MAG: peptidoglycan-binding protein [Oscillospiraceae bacterium]|nr:peptidoglycan-binding protein [Oscillospiraceae bacterium]